ncbi:protein FMC1 homolog isoform X1 [Heterocephalus glaber]|uniref:Protein FMC1 homolog isoform X1 n=1 Tax=Heterocephalus glaber TaxID=10181 RepID=A0AAX6TG89_HETGA|nr:protein FMC1 homolog isoform X1 [Heterocephalus glaber]
MSVERCCGCHPEEIGRRPRRPQAKAARSLLTPLGNPRHTSLSGAQVASEAHRGPSIAPHPQARAFAPGARAARESVEKPESRETPEKGRDERRACTRPRAVRAEPLPSGGAEPRRLDASWWSPRGKRLSARSVRAPAAATVVASGVRVLGGGLTASGGWRCWKRELA